MTRYAIWLDRYKMDTNSERYVLGGMHGVLGFGLCLGLNTIVTWFLTLVLPSGILFFVGFYQLLYVVPGVLFLKRRSRRAFTIGFVSCATLTFLLSAGILGLGSLGFLSA